MRKILNKMLGLVVWLLLFSVAQAVTISHLYTVEVPVHSQVVWRRLHVMPKAMQQVLVRVSGNSEVLNASQVQEALKQAPNYVSQFSYLNNPDKSNIENPFLIRLNFDGAAIRSVLRGAGQPIWGSNRPLLVVWVSLAQNQSTAILSSMDRHNSAVKDVMQQAQYYGLPVTLPMMDANEQQSIHPQLGLEQQWANIQTASQRYLPDEVLLVTIDASDPTKVTSQWDLKNDGNVQQWQANGTSVQQVIDQGMASLAQNLAKQFAVVENLDQNQQVEVQMVGLKGIDQLARAERYFNGLVGVKQVDVSRVSDDQATFELTLVGSLQSLLEEVRLGGKLVALNQAQAPGQQQVLAFQFVQ